MSVSTSSNDSVDDGLKNYSRRKTLITLSSGAINKMFQMSGRSNKITDKYHKENKVKNNISDIDEELCYAPKLLVFYRHVVKCTRGKRYWQFILFDGKYMMTAQAAGEVVDLFESGLMKVGTLFRADFFHIAARNVGGKTTKICYLFHATPFAKTYKSSLMKIKANFIDDVDMSGEQVIRERR